MKGIASKLAVLSLLLVGCKTVEPEIRYVETEKTVYKDRIVEVESPADSANIEALLKCDENGNVLVMQLQEESSKNANLSFKVDSLNRLVATFNTEPVLIPVEVHDTTYVHEVTDKEIVEVEVEKELNWFQKTFMFLGKICFTIMVGIGLFFLIKTIVENKTAIVKFINKLFGR